MGTLMRWADERAKKGQSVMEYGILLVVVATALMGMGLYVRRAVQGKLYAIDDQISPRPNVSQAVWTPPI
jgi:Flp pilus assembly pilin Flp